MGFVLCLWGFPNFSTFEPKYQAKNREKGRYRYAGQWKHGRMHGCGVYEVNERILYVSVAMQGRFYFRELLEEEHGCTVDICALYSGLAEVAAAKARMFVNKPFGMVKEQKGPLVILNMLTFMKKMIFGWRQVSLTNFTKCVIFLSSFSGTQRLPRLGLTKALEMILACKPVKAEEGHSLGLPDAGVY